MYVQDAAARLAVYAAGLAPGMRVLDCCAAPGGKSFSAAVAMEDRGELVSCDIHRHKITIIEKGAERLGLTCIQAMEHDAKAPMPRWREYFDAVIADVPCSGLGVIRKKPDIRYKDLGPTEALPALQLAILRQQAEYVRPGGVLLYSTCTILRRENEDVIRAFLADHPEFSPESICAPPDCPVSGAAVTLLPCLHGTDGFFIAKLRKQP